MGQEYHIDVRQVEALQAQVPSELSKVPPRDANVVVQNHEENSTVAGLVAIYTDLLMLHVLAAEHFHVPTEEEAVPEKKKESHESHE
jgi:hypothetical protein